ncbi:unnamed protein product [Urochloa decumbens]|uniref:Uncharacterized protein n=1 Tax=Urochloa decumbens TaxID=240449 RepID=A0ABC9E0R4_9POAL
MGERGMAHVPRRDDAAVLVGGRAAPLDHVQSRFLHAGRILVAGGWLVLTYTTVSNRAAANAEHALVGLALLLLGVFLIVLSPVAGQFPGAARVGVAVADAVLFYLFAPGN